MKRGYNKNKNILIEEYKSVYFYIPKNGCTTLKKHLFHYVGDDEHIGSIHKFDFPFVPSSLLNTEYSDYLKFTFVRNPWSRLVSCYKSKIRSPEFTNDYFDKGIHRGFMQFGEMFYGNMPFKEFVESVSSIPDSIGDPHFISQLFWLSDYSGMLNPNYIGRLENMNSAIDDIHQKTGLSLINMPTKNKSKYDTSYMEYYNEYLKEVVRKRYEGDIEIFGYEFETKPDIKPIGFVNDALPKKLANSKFVLKVLKEKCEKLKIECKNESNINLKNKLDQTLINSNRKLQQLSLSQDSKFLSFFKLKNILFKRKTY